MSFLLASSIGSRSPEICGDFTPVITTITFIAFSMSFEIWAPEISFASGDSCSPIFWTTCLYSSNDKSVPPITFTSAPDAFLMSTSRSGLFSALSTASDARSFESDSPIPIRDTPPFAMIALMSAKSRFTRPEDVTSSVIPLTALVRISSATLNAVGRGRSGARSRSLSFGITISVSTIPSIRSKPSIAFSIRFAPSTVKGRVTTPITSAPCFFAISATTGAAPVPVLWTTKPSAIKLWLLSTVISYTSSSSTSFTEDTLLNPKFLNSSCSFLLLYLYTKLKPFLVFG